MKTNTENNEYYKNKRIKEKRKKKHIQTYYSKENLWKKMCLLAMKKKTKKHYGPKICVFFFRQNINLI